MEQRSGLALRSQPSTSSLSCSLLLVQQQQQKQHRELVVQDPEVSGDDLVREDGAPGDVDDLVLVGDDDDFAAERDVLAERHVP